MKLELRGITKVFGSWWPTTTSTWSQPGRSMLLCEFGAGKSTLMTLYGLYQPTTARSC